ncbi:MAG: cell division FtsA domain-containing protein, partial [Paludibacteraceae bacterium]|nr:cell division FtsA domain-containing protein [Paludibacteraceae bacterium]
MNAPVITSATAVFEIGNHYLNFALGVCEQDKVNVLYYQSAPICGCKVNRIVDAGQLTEQIRKTKETVEKHFHILLNQAYYTAPLLIGTSEKFAVERKSLMEEMRKIASATAVNLTPSTGGMQAVERMLPVSSKGKSNTLLLDLGYSTMGVVIVKNGQCAQQTMLGRSILQTVTDMLTARGATLQEAKTILRRAGSAVTPIDELRFRVGEGSMRKSELSQYIQTELQTMLSPLREKLQRFLEAGMPVYISGEGTSLTGIRDFLSDFFGTEVQEADWGG